MQGPALLPTTLHTSPQITRRSTSKGVRQRAPEPLDLHNDSPPLTCLRFHVLLPLFSECFSSFPHGTCSLSVSCQYLVSDGVYHPLQAAFPNSPTPSTLAANKQSRDHGLITLYKAPFEETCPMTTNSCRGAPLHNSLRIPGMDSSRFVRHY